MRKIVYAIGMTLALALPAASQTWPERPVRLLVGFGAGGPTDQAARIVADSMGTSLGQPVVVENMPGAGSGIAIRAMLNAPADGYTMVVGTTGFPVAEARYSNNESQMARDFDYIGTIAGYPHLLGVKGDSSYKTLSDFIEAAKAAKDPLTVGTNSHTSELLVLNLAQKAGVELEFIPYPGQPGIATDLLAGRLDAAIISPSTLQSFEATGDMRAIGASTGKRFTLLPNVPTFEEGGLPGFDTMIWNGLLLRKGTDPQIVTKLSEALKVAIEAPEVIERLKVVNLEAVYSSPEDFREKAVGEVAAWNAVLDAAGVERLKH